VTTANPFTPPFTANPFQFAPSARAPFASFGTPAQSPSASLVFNSPSPVPPHQQFVFGSPAAPMPGEESMEG
jgi:hypothetical protein